jgi:hypothetical protein
MYRGASKTGEILGFVDCINGNIRVVKLYQYLQDGAPGETA